MWIYTAHRREAPLMRYASRKSALISLRRVETTCGTSKAVVAVFCRDAAHTGSRSHTLNVVRG